MIFIILGITYIGAATRAGQAWAASNSNLARWELIGVTLLLLLLAIAFGVVFLK